MSIDKFNRMKFKNIKNPIARRGFIILTFTILALPMFVIGSFVVSVITFVGTLYDMVKEAIIVYKDNWNYEPFEG